MKRSGSFNRFRKLGFKTQNFTLALENPNYADDENLIT